MLNKKLKKSDGEGFTIIEVMIVLAIAGLILLIIFLAVPALQRNSRNTQRKNDIAGLLGAVNEFQSNNNGRLPASAADQTAVLNSAGTGYYTGQGGGQGQIAFAAGAQTALPNTAANDRVVLVTGAACGANGATVVGSSRQVSAQFLTETRGGFTASCQES